MSDKCVVNSCCCGCSLRTGSMATAIYCVISGLLSTISTAYQVTRTHNNAGWFNVVVYALMLVVAILLLHGVRKDNPKLIRIWVYVQIALTIFIAISVVIFIVQIFDISTLTVALIVIAINIYLIIVVRSYAIQLESGGGAVGSPA